MRFMIIVKATKDSEAGVMPEETLLAEMAGYHEELARAGILLDGSGLQPSAKGWRIKYSGKEKTMVNGGIIWKNSAAVPYSTWPERVPEPSRTGVAG